MAIRSSPFAVPDKIFGLALFLDFIDRCTHCAWASSATGSAQARATILPNPNAKILSLFSRIFLTETTPFFIHSHQNTQISKPFSSTYVFLLSLLSRTPVPPLSS